MAISDVGHRGAAAAGIGPGQSLFERLPARLFGPLASGNRHRYWALLCSLHARRFGPDAPLPPSFGFALREITRDIEEELAAQDEWESEDGQTPETPLGIRAIGVFNRLRDSGWFRVDRHGVREMVSVAPVVAQFMTRLVEFAQTGPVFVAGKVRSIEANLLLVINAGADGDTLQEAAAQARNLLEHVRNTGTNVRDLMASFSADMTTAQYVRRFFSDYIERVFIGDYRELRTREHPLSRRQQIIETIEAIHADVSHRGRLIGWYQAKRAQGDIRRAELMFERDVQRLLEMRRIDEYLDRLDDEIQRANKRAIAFLDYRLKSLRPIDQLVGQAISAVLANPMAAESVPFAAGELMASSRLAEPRKDIPRQPPTALRDQVLSTEEEARSRILLRARNVRSMTPPKLAAFVLRAVDGKDRVNSEELAVASIEDVRALQTLSSLSMAMSENSRALRIGAMTMARGFTVQQEGTDELEGRWISHVRFRVDMRRRIPKKEVAR